MNPSNPRDPRQLRVLTCASGQRAEQARLAGACFKKPVAESGLVWRYDRNPHGPTHSFLQVDPQGNGVSGYACNARVAWSFGDPQSLATIGETGDVMTHPEWRKLGLFSALDQAAREATRASNWPLIFGLPNGRSAHIFLELGWQQVGEVRFWTHVLQGGARTRALRRADGRWAAWSVAWHAWRAAQARARLSQAAQGYSTRAITQFPAEVSALSAQVARSFAWMIRRDADYLRWRFLESPSGLHRALGVYDPSGNFAGYCVVQIPRPGEFVGFLIDLLSPDAAARAAGIAAGLELLRAAGALLVRASAIHGSWWEAQLQAAGFAPPRSSQRLSVILYPHQPQHPLALAGLNAASWYLTDGDRDDETMG